MKMKKLLASALAAAMVVSSMVGAMVTSAETTTVGTITAGTVDATVGETDTVAVPVVIEFTEGIVAPHNIVTVALQDYKLTSVTDIEVTYVEGKGPDAGMDKVDVDPDGSNLSTGKILLETAVDEKAPTVTKIAFTANFEDADDVDTEPGTYPITVNGDDMTDVNERSIGIDAVPGSLTVAEAAHVCTPAEAVVENNVDPTCTEAGSYDSVIYCSECGEEISRETITVEATDHTAAEAVVENNVDATCGAAGSYDSVVYCSVCNEEISRQTVTVDATGEHNYVDGTCDVCGAEDPDYVAEVNINGVSRMKSLSLKDVIYVNPFVGFVEVKDGKNYNTTAVDKAFIVENGKILFWDTNPGDNAVIGTETAVSSVEYDSDYKDTNDAEKIHEYKGKSMGIPAKNFGDTIYYRTYIVIDGKEYYGDIIEYSVQTYCYNQINSSTTTEKQNKLRALCATMLNFGSAAQIQLKYNVDNLSNSILPGLVDAGKLDAKYLEQNWDESLLIPANTPATDMIVNFAQNDASITERTLQLKGAIEPKITMGYKIVSDKATVLPEGADLTFYFWTSEQYESLAAAGTPLSKDNASTTKTLGEFDENGVAEVELSYTSSYGYEYWAKPEPISARNLEKTFYFVAIVTEADGTEYCTGVNSYSPIQYAINQLAKATTTSNANLQDLCRWIVLYWDAAKAYLG